MDAAYSTYVLTTETHEVNSPLHSANNARKTKTEKKKRPDLDKVSSRRLLEKTSEGSDADADTGLNKLL